MSHEAQNTPACAGLDDNTMFPEPDSEHYAADVEFAKSICAACPVAIRRKCLVWALANKEAHGVWGGHSEEERGNLLKGLEAEAERRRARGRKPKTIDDAAAARMHAAGKSKREIASLFGVTMRTVQRSIKAAAA